ncbi:MAG: MBL fold metallo-hydrolase [Alphaproteobacteria bacterium]
MKLHAIAYNQQDNYAYFVESEKLNLLVDAGNFEDITTFLDTHNLKPDYILLTHQHGDHVADAPKFKEKYGAKIIAAAVSPLDYADLNEKDVADLGLSFQQLSGHTEDSGLWLLDDENAQPFAAFTGDVIFSCGCGRQFQGIDERLLNAMEHIKQLDNRYKLCCGHEYALTNVKFCLEYFADDIPLLNYFHRLQVKAVAGEPTMPINLETEKQVNPFLRFDEEILWQKIDVNSPLDFVIKLRKLRDQY